MKKYMYKVFVKDVQQLLQELQNYDAKAIVGIARGGLTLSHALSEGLCIRNVQSLRCELYDGTKKRKRHTLRGACSFEGVQRVLVVDDIADSGETLQEVMAYLRERHKGVEFRSATLFYKKTSIYEPHYWIHEAREWIEFFWESDFK